MKVKVYGYKRVDYVSKKTGRPVKGWNIFITRDSTDYERSNYGHVGTVCEDLYMPDSFDPTTLFLNGTDYDVVFNRFGGIDQFTMI